VSGYHDASASLSSLGTSWVGSRACMEDLKDRRIPYPSWIRTPDRSARSPVSALTTPSLLYNRISFFTGFPVNILHYL